MTAATAPIAAHGRKEYILIWNKYIPRMNRGFSGTIWIVPDHSPPPKKRKPARQNFTNARGGSRQPRFPSTRGFPGVVERKGNIVCIGKRRASCSTWVSPP